MPDKTPQSNSRSGQSPRLSPCLSGGWAFAVGTCAGCGSLIVSGGAFLAGAGLWGTLLGLLAGAAVMWIVCRNYAYLMSAFPEAGGAYAYAREIFGYDHGFLVSWFLSLIYFALLWANAASLPFFARFFLGDAFSFGKWYTVFGCDVDPGSILLPAAVLLGVAFLCIRGSRFSVRFMVGLAVLLIAGVAVCTIGALPGKNRLWAPAFAEGSSGWLQVVRIAGLSPLLFVGIESVSHGMEEASFRYSKALRILLLALLSVTLLCVCVNPIALGLLKTPGEMSADVVVGEGQPLGIPLSYGGPYLGIFAVRKELIRKVSGRIVGQTVDNRGQKSYVLTLTAREQHIRREKATSNICSNQGLNALTAAIYLSLLGKEGLKEVASLCYNKAHYAAQKISELKGFEILNPGPFFHEFVVKCPKPVEELQEHLLDHNILGGFDLSGSYPVFDNCLLIAVTEMNSKQDIDDLCLVLKGGHHHHEH